MRVAERVAPGEGGARWRETEAEAEALGEELDVHVLLCRLGVQSPLVKRARPSRVGVVLTGTDTKKQPLPEHPT